MPAGLEQQAHNFLIDLQSWHGEIRAFDAIRGSSRQKNL